MKDRSRGLSFSEKPFYIHEGMDNERQEKHKMKGHMRPRPQRATGTIGRRKINSRSHRLSNGSNTRKYMKDA